MALFGIVLVAAVVFVLFTEEGTSALQARATTEAKSGANAEDDGELAAPADGSADVDRAETTADPAPVEPTDESAKPAIPPDACGFSGRIIGRDGKPLAGVEVHAVRRVSLKETTKFGVEFDAKRGGRFARSAVSDELGRFTIIEVVPSDDYMVVAETKDGLMGQRWGVEALEKLVFEVGDIALRAGARVRGTVRTEAGGTVANARITVGWSWDAHDVVSDAKGAFDAGIVYPGQQQIQLDAKGYALKDAVQREFVEGDDVDDLELVVIPSAMISGRVYDESGRGIANASIWASKQQTEEDGWNGVWIGGSTVTAADGTFEFGSMSPGKYQLNVDAPGYMSAYKEIDAGGPPLEFPMTRANWIEGLVVDAQSGAPVKPESIRLHWIPPWERDNPNAELEQFWGNDDQVDLFDDGRFKYGLEASGTFVVEATAAGYGAGRSERFVLSEHGSATGILVRLEKSLDLVVTVLDAATRQPVTGAVAEAWTLVREEGDDNVHQIRALGYSGGRTDSVSRFGGQLGERRSRVPTAADGTAKLHSVQPGMHAVIARKDGYARGRVNDIEIVRGQAPGPVEVLLNAGGSITGRITNENSEPEPAIKVFAFSVDNERGEAVSLEGGVYTIEHLPPGRYRVEAQPEGGMYVNERNNRRRDGRELTMQERFPVVVEEGRATPQDLKVERIIPGSLKGVITINGRPTAGLNVSVAWVDPNARGRRNNYGWWGGNQAKTDAMGNFTFRRLRPGTYTVTVNQGWRRSFQVGEAVVNPGVESNVSFDVQLGGVYGRVVDADGKPVQNVQMWAYRKQADGSSQWSGDYGAQTNENGEFTIEGMQAGTWQLNCSVRGYQQKAEDNLQITGYRNVGPLEIRLTRGGWLKVTLTGLARTSNGWPGVQVTVRNPQGEEIYESWDSPEGDECVLWVQYDGEGGGTMSIRAGGYDNSPVYVGSANVPSTKNGVADVTVPVVPGT
ncbi:MAG: carboxypeptidase regulatory-like domain-containing protein [Planctomycetes bacterium]|nr:carboxypeptidase regulatory-like domain-containing protein [Planctomycetota bacterium]